MKEFPEKVMAGPDKEFQQGRKKSEEKEHYV
jgi:hypothetical protein